MFVKALGLQGNGSGGLKLYFQLNTLKAELCKPKVIFQDLTLSVMGILNDATGTLMSCAHKDPNCRVGVIIGELMMIPAL